MKTMLEKIRDWATLAVLCGALVTAGWALRELKEIKETVKGYNEFQRKQIELNASRALLDEWVTNQIMDRDEEDE